ncbi:DUF5677 domain-containing protein [Vibrio cyclitrophicus]|uniref:DUF5677 domain-containing protein n=1 Tax=Vibrio cyclitrophicus TaxID=47951 RepID=UPI000C85E9B7|nr:DUF5677 domain-containing protein [Vibrio cyclitrophicus]PMF26025.1 hypothetical protein BCV17_21290 [Vibrio cyclitrophicus]
MNYRIEELNELVTIADRLCTGGERTSATTFKAYHAEEVFNKLCLHLNSLRNHLSFHASDQSNIDISVLASIVRMIIESSNAVFYFCERGLSDEEVEFRVYLYAHHHSIEQNAILEKLSIDTRWFSHWGFSSIRVLEENKYFQSLTQGEQKQLLKGQKAYYRRGVRSKLSPFPKEIEEGLYKLFSNYTHSFPLGNTLYMGRGNLNPLNIVNSLFLVIETAISFSSSAMKSYSSLRRKIGQRVTAEEKLFVKNAAKSKCLIKWLEQENRNQKARMF